MADRDRPQQRARLVLDPRRHFLGDSVAEAIYGDESKLWVFDGQTGAAVTGRTNAQIESGAVCDPVG